MVNHSMVALTKGDYPPWQGQSWAALNLDPAQGLAIGDRVTVLGREGTRLQVMGREGPGGWLQSEGDKAPETSISRKPWS